MSQCRTSPVLEEVLAERQRQEAKWGQQNHPSFDQALLSRDGGCTPGRMALEYEVPAEARGKYLCETAFAVKAGTYGHILMEEVAEVFATCNDRSEATTRADLVQVAAVAVAWIEAIDRRRQQ